MEYILGGKICGCPVDEDDSEIKKRFSRASRGQRNYHAIDTMIECKECGQVYFRREEFHFPKQVHPVWHNWSKKVEVKKEDQLGQESVKEKRIYHDDYTKSFEWCDPSHVKDMRRGEDLNPDNVFYSLNEDLDNLTISDKVYNFLNVSNF